jgi:hypothetical protein
MNAGNLDETPPLLYGVQTTGLLLCRRPELGTNLEKPPLTTVDRR